MQALIRSLRSRLVYHTSFVDTVQGFLRQQMDRDLDQYLRAIFAAVGDQTAGLRSSKPNVVETHSATLRTDVSSTLTHLDGRLAALASEHSVTTSSSLLGPGEAPPPSQPQRHIAVMYLSILAFLPPLFIVLNVVVVLYLDYVVSSFYRR